MAKKRSLWLIAASIGFALTASLVLLLLVGVLTWDVLNFHGGRAADVRVVAVVVGIELLLLATAIMLARRFAVLMTLADTSIAIWNPLWLRSLVIDADKTSSVSLVQKTFEETVGPQFRMSDRAEARFQLLEHILVPASARRWYKTIHLTVETRNGQRHDAFLPDVHAASSQSTVDAYRALVDRCAAWSVPVDLSESVAASIRIGRHKDSTAITWVLVALVLPWIVLFALLLYFA